jgi:predicted acyltransferase
VTLSNASLDLAAPASPPGQLPGERLASLDAFRGITILLMVLVNASGPAVYSQFHHSAWNGCTLADAVFPSFLWIMGVAITLAFRKRLAAGMPRPALLARLLHRSVILYLLGVFLYLFPQFDLAHMRILGVLQRIALCYLLAAAMYLYFGLRAQIAWAAALLVLYWAAIMLIPVPGFGAGNLTVEGNLAHYLDRLVLGAHNWTETGTWDPEGLLSTLPALATTLLGVLAGRLIQMPRSVNWRSFYLCIGGCGLVVAGLVCSVWLPINKNLWTSSFALLMAGIDSLALAALLWLIDGRERPRWAQPFIIIGMNAIAVYLLSELLPEALVVGFSAGNRGGTSLEHAVFSLSFMPAPVLQLLYALVFALFMYAFAWLLYRKRWFLRL